ncbi:hypothetical protein KPL74_04540 [Bacillus sp. NP157]|nr:hypothetical protein KPL74_04540 [Bacillus sp. NP157]
MTHHMDSIPPLHDGHLTGLLVKDQEARIFVQTAAGAPFTLILSGVKRLNVDGFAEGNIILDCEVSASTDIATDILVALNHGGAREEHLEKLRALVASGGYQLFSIAPSYGAWVVALIKGITVREGTSVDSDPAV